MTKRNRMLLGRFALFTLQFVNIINITGNSTSITHHLHKTATTTITRGLTMTVLQDCTFIHNPPSAREINIKLTYAQKLSTVYCYVKIKRISAFVSLF